MRRRAPWRVGGLLASMLLVTSCGGDGGTVANEVTLGAVLPLSGPDSAVGEEVLAGLQLAAGLEGPEVRVKLQALDGQGSPGPSARRFRELVENPEVGVIVGGWFAATARTLAALAAPEEVAFLALSPLAAPSRKVSDPGFFPVHRLDALAAAAAKFAQKDLKARHAGVISLSGSEVSRVLSTAFGRVFEHLGGEILWTLAPDSEGKLSLPKGPEAKVDVLYVAAHSDWAVRAVDLAKKSTEAAVILSEGWEISSVPQLTQKGRRVFLTSFFSEGDPASPTADFLTACAENGVTPSLAVAIGWDTIRVVRNAAGNGASREGMKSSLRTGEPVAGATGRIGRSTLSGFFEAPAISQASEEGFEFVRRVRAVQPSEEGEA